MDGVRRDLDSARRALRVSPGFAIAALGMLAVGVAMWTLMFSILEGVVLRPLPVRDQDRILLAWRTDKLAGAHTLPFREDLLTRFAASTRTFAAVASMNSGGVVDGAILNGDRIVYLGRRGGHGAAAAAARADHQLAHDL